MDFNILTLMIPALDFAPRIRDYETQVADLRVATDDAGFRKHSEGLMNAVSELAKLLTSLLKRLNAVALPTDITVGVSDILFKVSSIGKLVEALETAALVGRSSGDAAGANTIPGQRSFTDCFSNLLIQYNRVQDIANYYRRGKDWSTAQYPPHLALLITFLHLYGHVSNQLNRLTKAHLDFYYRHILGLASLPEIPDQVKLLFVPEVNAGKIHLPAGEVMLAEIPGRDEPLKYRLTTDLRVTKTTVAALRTLFMSDRRIFADDVREHRLIRNMQLYQGDYVPIQAGALLKGGAVGCWPLFGEDQEDLAIDQRSMSDAVIGLLLASPIFYLPEGERLIRLTFRMVASSFEGLSTYIKRFATASQKTEQAAQHELLSRTFVIEVTVADGWSIAEKYSVRIPEENSLEVLIELRGGSQNRWRGISQVSTGRS